MLTKTFIMTAIVLLGATSFASAASINQRQNWQNQRIYHGVQNGSLTYKEYKALQRGQRRVQMLKNIARADGVMTPWERAAIQNFQNYQSARIYNKKHN